MRTIRRHPSGSVTISLVVRDRPWSAVIADMIDGFVAANGVGGELASEQLRDVLWAAVECMNRVEVPSVVEGRVHALDDAA